MQLIERVENLEKNEKNISERGVNAGSNFSSISLNSVVKNGKLVHCSFRGQVGDSGISSNTEIFSLPYTPASPVEVLGWISSSQYSNFELYFSYLTKNNKSYKGGSLATGKWLVCDFWYLTND